MGLQLRRALRSVSDPEGALKGGLSETGRALDSLPSLSPVRISLRYFWQPNPALACALLAGGGAQLLAVAPGRGSRMLWSGFRNVQLPLLGPKHRGAAVCVF